ncbi:small nuclear ribonucleoprotein E-like [Pistacia vera]|uniref:small nuclear ribonucleoprotein E-like n=1 Tax=Pistacia vera TaxID=55513 RepID=UPI001262AF38|nr:small nuclear ribonucleoprotein E-like [Pistacia vera]
MASRDSGSLLDLHGGTNRPANGNLPALHLCGRARVTWHGTAHAAAYRRVAMPQCARHGLLPFSALSRDLQNLIFRFLQSKTRIQISLFEQKDLRIEGQIIGFDEYMNLVLDDAETVHIKKKTRKSLGRILLKGDNITLMMNT